MIDRRTFVTRAAALLGGLATWFRGKPAAAEDRHARLEREHLGDPDKQTGIYRFKSPLVSSPGMPNKNGNVFPAGPYPYQTRPEVADAFKSQLMQVPRDSYNLKTATGLQIQDEVNKRLAAEGSKHRVEEVFQASHDTLAMRLSLLSPSERDAMQVENGKNFLRQAALAEEMARRGIRSPLEHLRAVQVLGISQIHDSVIVDIARMPG